MRTIVRTLSGPGECASTPGAVTGTPGGPDMANGNGRVAPQDRSYSPKFPDEVAAWIATNGDVIDALLALRDLGDEAAEAVEATGEVRRVVRLRISFELWSALCEGDGDDPEELLLERLPFHVLDRLRRAIWGSPWDDDDAAPRLRVVR